MKKLLTVLGVVLLLASTTSWSDALQTAKDAYDNKNYATALREFTPLAEQGNAEAQYYLGQMYKYGLGVTRNNKTAMQWFTRAAEQGHANAQYYLGQMYKDGLGVAQNYKTALQWVTRAAEQGYAEAQTYLGQTYLGQTSLMEEHRRNYKTSRQWYTRAAEQGDADAQRNLGYMYLYGQGVVQDDIYAYMWFNIAAVNGDGSAIESRDTLKQQMSPDEILEANKLSRDCVKKEYKGCGL